MRLFYRFINNARSRGAGTSSALRHPAISEGAVGGRYNDGTALSGISGRGTAGSRAAGGRALRGASLKRSGKGAGTGGLVADMTEGSVTGHIAAFALPMFVGYLFQQFYSMVDTIIVGKFLGVYALAGVGSTSAINFMVIGFCTGICSGFCIPVAQAFGAGSFPKMRKFIANSIWLSAGFALTVMTAVCMLTGNILTLMNTDADIYEYAYTYIFIVFAGIPATMLYNLCSSIIRSLGDSRTPVYFLLLSSGLNIVLDIYTIGSLGMGVEGAAYATVISQLAAGLISAVYMYGKYEIIRFSHEEGRPDKKCIRKLITLGVPMGLQYTITAVGSVILQTAVNGLGYAAVAAVAAGTKIRMFICTPFDALGGTMATFSAQNVGAGRMDRVRKGLVSATMLGFAYSALSLVITLVFGETLCGLFADESEAEVIGMAETYLLIDAVFAFALALVNIYRFSMQGMGFSGFAMLAGIMEMAGRGIAAFWLVPVFGFTAACLSSPIAWIFADIFLLPGCIRCLGLLEKKNPHRCGGSVNKTALPK